MEDEQFEELVQRGLDEIPRKFIERLDNLAIVIEDEPSAEQRERLHLHDGVTLFGLYEGIPLTERGSGYTLVLPDKITIFKNPILEAAGQKEDIPEMVAETVWHEIAHHFGIEEEDVRRREARRRERRYGTETSKHEAAYGLEEE